MNTQDEIPLVAQDQVYTIIQETIHNGEDALHGAEMFVCHIVQHPGQDGRPIPHPHLNSGTPPGHQPDRLKNTLKPTSNLGRDMTLEESVKFDQWFIWNKAILYRKGYHTQRVLLENSLNVRMLSKMKTNVTVTAETPIQGGGRLLKKLASYYIEDNPMIIRRHTFTSCKQE